MATAQACVTEILARLNAALTPTAYDLGKVPTSRPAEFVEIALSRRVGGEPRACSFIGTTSYRLTVAAVSQVTVANVRNSLERVRADLEFSALVVGSESSTPIQFETDDEADYGAGWFSEYMAFTFTL